MDDAERARYERAATALSTFVVEWGLSLNPEDAQLMAFAALKYADSDASHDDICREVRAMIAEDHAEHQRMLAAMEAANPKTPHWVKFEYCEFYDVPREILFEFEGVTFLLESAFDQEADDYSPQYVIYLLEGSLDRSGSWAGFAAAGEYVGEFPVTMLEFDPTSRSEFDISIIERLLQTTLDLRD